MKEEKSSDPRISRATKKTTTRDLEALTRKELLQKVGKTGHGTYYVLSFKGDIKGTKGTSTAEPETGRKPDKSDIKGSASPEGSPTAQPAQRPLSAKQPTNAPSASAARTGQKRDKRDMPPKSPGSRRVPKTPKRK